jgi:predicted permease
MISVFLSLALIAGAGASLRYLFPAMDIEYVRKSISKIVLYIILPALIFNVIYHADAGRVFYHVPVAAAGGVLVALAVAAVVIRFFRLPDSSKGALILACVFGNVTYLGLPVLVGIFSDIPEKISVVAVLYDVTASTLLLSVGALVAVRISGGSAGGAACSGALQSFPRCGRWRLHSS